MTFVMLTFIGVFGGSSNPILVNCNAIKSIEQKSSHTLIKASLNTSSNNDVDSYEVREKAADIIEVCRK